MFMYINITNLENLENLEKKNVFINALISNIYTVH